MIQIHSIATHETDPRAGRVPRTTDYPALHRCYLADLTAAGAVRPVAFADTDAPATPREHLDTLLRHLDRAGYRAYGWPRHVTPHLAVLNVCVPGLERFMLVTDGVPVLPGRRGRDHRTRR